VVVGFHILTPDAGEVGVRCSADLRPARGGESVWHLDTKTTVPANAAVPPALTLPMVAPMEEGTYVLELRATWEPVVAHDSGKLINRLIRRGKRGLFGPSSATRRVTLAVMGPADPSKEKAAASAAKRPVETEVDTVDLARLRGHRAWGSGRSAASATGRSAWTVPDEALAEATTRERLRGLIGRGGTEVSTLGPADATGQAWSSVGLRVAHPGRPHRLTLTVTGGHPTALGVAMVGPALATAAAGGSPPAAGPARGPRSRLLLDAAASGPPVLPEGPPGKFSWLVWPDSTEPVVVVVNRAQGGPVLLGSLTLSELSELPPGPVVEPPQDAPARSLGLTLTGPDGLERFGSWVDGGLTDVLGGARNFATYAASCGATAAVVPETLADRERRRALDGTAAEDCTGPDRLALTRRVLARRGLAAWLELSLDGALPGLPAPTEPEALARGVVRVDRRGQADGPVAAYNPLTDDVAAALKQRVTEALSVPKGDVPLAGLLVRLGAGPTLLGGPDTGCDDATFERFVREAFDAETARGVPGRSTDDPGRFAARARFVSGPGRMPWLAWRTKRVASLYGELAAAAREALPGAELAVATPGPDDGPAGDEARRIDLAGLPPTLAWRAVGLDLDAWPDGEGAPVVFRGVGLGSDDLAHDLATSPELDAKVAARPARGFLLDAGGNDPSQGLRLRSAGLTDGPEGDEPLGHALAALDARFVWLAAAAVSGQEERLRKFAGVYRALPASPPSERRPLAFGVAVRAHPAGEHTFVAMANDTPYPVRLDTVLNGPADAPVFDLARGVGLKAGSDPTGRHLVLDLPPFGVTAVRVGSDAVKIGSVTPYPSESVVATLETRYNDVSARLTRLNRAGDREKNRSGPPNPGFEPEGPHEPGVVAAGAEPMAPAALPAPEGWTVVGGMGDGVVLDPAAPHSGRTALRLDAVNPPASAVCEPFHPGVHSPLVVRAWMRADRPDARVRVWIEGGPPAKPFRRVSELTPVTGWAERAVRVGDLSAVGPEGVRLRFELLSAGSLWVDDVAVAGEGLSEPERRNARNALLAALQAYREKRFADFARLSGSRWARQAGNDGDGPTERVASDRPGLNAVPGPSALPATRRLR
jgi:hypothetical protein